MTVAAFDSFEEPIYRAFLHWHLKNTLGRQVCCDRGHRTPRAAAQHAAALAVAEWEKAG